VLIFHEISKREKTDTLDARKTANRTAKEYTSKCRKESEGDNHLVSEVSDLSRYKRRIIYDHCCISDSSRRFYNGSTSYAAGFSNCTAAARTLYARRKKGSRKPHSLSIDFHALKKIRARGTFVLDHERGTVRVIFPCNNLSFRPVRTIRWTIKFIFDFEYSSKILDR